MSWAQQALLLVIVAAAVVVFVRWLMRRIDRSSREDRAEEPVERAPGANVIRYLTAAAALFILFAALASCD